MAKFINQDIVVVINGTTLSDHAFSVEISAENAWSDSVGSVRCV